MKRAQKKPLYDGINCPNCGGVIKLVPESTQESVRHITREVCCEQCRAMYTEHLGIVSLVEHTDKNRIIQIFGVKE